MLLQVIAELSEHLHEVAVMARSTRERMGIAGEDLEIMVRAAELQDLGKIAVADAMLLKPSSSSGGSGRSAGAIAKSANAS